MTRFFDHSTTADLPVEVPVLAELQRSAARHNTSILVIGAAARDLVVHLPAGEQVERATLDIDVAVATQAGEHFRALTAEFDAVIDHPHRFLVHGVTVDIVPFGPIESASRAVAMGEGHVLDVNGIAEAAASADLVQLTEELTVPVASLPAQSALKVLAWRDRHSDTRKDAVDLCSLLEAAGAHHPYVDECWSDDHALEEMGHDIVRAGAYRTWVAGCPALHRDPPGCGGLRTERPAPDRDADQ